MGKGPLWDPLSSALARSIKISRCGGSGECRSARAQSALPEEVSVLCPVLLCMLLCALCCPLLCVSRDDDRRHEKCEMMLVLREETPLE